MGGTLRHSGLRDGSFFLPSTSPGKAAVISPAFPPHVSLPQVGGVHQLPCTSCSGLSASISECLLILNSREQIIRLQGQVDKQYAGLKDMAEERRRKLENMYHLFQLKREADDLEQWITEKERMASSLEMGQDFDHVTVSTHNCFLCLPRMP